LVRRRQHVREPWGPDEPVELANKKWEKTCVNSEQKYSESGETGNGYFFLEMDMDPPKTSPPKTPHFPGG
jgi:hypothetical protein